MAWSCTPLGVMAKLMAVGLMVAHMPFLHAPGGGPLQAGRQPASSAV